MDKRAPTELALGEKPVRAKDSLRGPVLVGTLITVLFFGVLGGWAAFAPLDGAIVSEGVVTVEGYRKTVDHLEGGIVKEIRVKDGDRVQAGDTLLVLDDARLKAQAEIYSQQMAVARATEARLQAELAGETAVAFPADLAASDLDYVQRALASQEEEFGTRRQALTGAEQVLQHRIEELKSQIAGMELRTTSLEEQVKSIDDEKATLEELIESGLTTRSRILELERSARSIESEIADNQAAIAAAQQNMAGSQQQILQLSNDRRSQVAEALADVQLRMLDIGPQLDNAQAALARTQVKSPYEGLVVGLTVTSIGEVIAPGATILDIVPESTSMVIDARVRVEDITDLRVGARAEVHFTSYARLYVPVMHGTVTTVSADRLKDERTGVAFYRALISVDEADLKQANAISMYPGMPASVMIITQSRSALEYLISPLLASFDSAFRQN